MELQPPPTSGTTPGSGPGDGDVLARALELAAALPAAGAVRAVVAEVLIRTLASFTATVSMRDPVPDTAPGSPQEALAVVAGIEQLRSGLAALDASWQVTTEQRVREADADHGVREEDQGRGAAQEMALARRISPTSSSLSLAAARRLVALMPSTLDLLAEGRIPERNAQAITGALDGAGPEACAAIDEWIEEDPARLDGLGTGRTRQLVRELCQALDPRDSRGRAERAARKRGVSVEPLGNGMARLTATLRALDAAAIMADLGTAAEARRAAGARDTHQALQADELVARVLGAPVAASTPSTPASHVRLDVGIVITDRALLEREDDAECADIEGYGPIPAHIITDTLRGRPPGSIIPTGASWPREEDADIATSSVFRRLYTHPRTGELVAMESTARAFPTGLARMIRWRDRTCRTPWCNARIRHLDHVQAHAGGGPTSFENGQGLCARCNYLKEHGGWSVRPTTEPPDHSGVQSPSIIWRSPHGARGSSPAPRRESPRRSAARGSAEPDPSPKPAPRTDHDPSPRTLPRTEPGPRTDPDPSP